MCGEKTWLRLCAIAQQGSPPHVRGKGARPGYLHQLPGITPACAGKSVCLFLEPVVMLGSPPHVRGKAQKMLNHSDPARITPACAGKRNLPLSALCGTRDHPRMCGEKSPYQPKHKAK